MTNRDRIVDLILTERNRQYMLWTEDHDLEHSVNDWIALILHQLSKLTFNDNSDDIRRCMKKVAALAIAAMESQ